MKIFLDDQMNEPGMPNRQVSEGYVGVRNFREFKELLEEALARGERVEALDFDNDLGEEMEGWHIAKWLTETHPELFEHVQELGVHSENRGGGRDRIEHYFELGRTRWRELIEARERPHPLGEMKKFS